MSQKKSRATVTRNAAELAKALGLTPADGANIALRSGLNSKIVNRKTKDISADLLLRVLYSLGYTAKIKFQKAA
jgi:hypothetical protein